MNIRKYLNPESTVFLFFLFLCLINGSSWAFADSYDHMSNVDVQTYVGLFNFDLDQHPVRRYRIIVPFLAAGVHFILGPVLTMLSPNNFPGDFPTIMSFLIVNNALMALYALLIYKICSELIGANSYWPSIIGVVSVLSCRWTPYISGSALVDSLYLVVVGLLLLGILQKKSWLIILAIYLGPWSKEAFIFFVPLLLFTDMTNWIKWLIHLLLSGVIIFSFRYLFDQYIGADFTQSLTRDVSHFQGIGGSLKRLFSFHGLYEVASIGGFWNLLIIAGLFLPHVRERFNNLSKPFWGLFLILVLGQALLSYELARMFYLATPFLAVVIAIIISELLSTTKAQSFESA